MISDSIRNRREAALKFCYGYYFQSNGDEFDDAQTGLGRELDARPLSQDERNEIIQLMEQDNSVRQHYIFRFKERNI